MSMRAGSDAAGPLLLHFYPTLIPSINGLLDGANIGGDVIIVCAGSINRDDLIHRLQAPFCDVGMCNELVPILETLFPCVILAISVILWVPCRSANIAEGVCGCCHTLGPEGTFLQEKSECVGRVDVVLYPIVVERLAFAAGWGLVIIQHIVDELDGDGWFA